MPRLVPGRSAVHRRSSIRCAPSPSWAARVYPERSLRGRSAKPARWPRRPRRPSRPAERRRPRDPVPAPRARRPDRPWGPSRRSPRRRRSAPSPRLWAASATGSPARSRDERRRPPAGGHRASSGPRRTPCRAVEWIVPPASRYGIARARRVAASATLAHPPCREERERHQRPRGGRRLASDLRADHADRVGRRTGRGSRERSPRWPRRRGSRSRPGRHRRPRHRVG